MAEQVPVVLHAGEYVLMPGAAFRKEAAEALRRLNALPRPVSPRAIGGVVRPSDCSTDEEG